MAVKQLSATVHVDVYEQFEQVRRQQGEKRSQAVEEAIKLWLKARDYALIAEACQVERQGNLALAKASKKKATKVLAKRP